jgi:predicted transcriptional regulator
MATDLTIKVPDELRAAMESAARSEGKTVDDLAVEAMQKHLARRFLERMKREAEVRRGNMTDEAVEEVVDRAIHDYRSGR